MGTQIAAAEFQMQPRTGKVFTARIQLQQKIKSAEEELKTSGPIHARDLQKHIHRMRKELRIYDRLQAGNRHL